MQGTLTLPNGDYIEGQFNGSFSDGIKVNGMFRKATLDHMADSKLICSVSCPVFPKYVVLLCIDCDVRCCLLTT